MNYEESPRFEKMKKRRHTKGNRDQQEKQKKRKWTRFDKQKRIR